MNVRVEYALTAQDYYEFNMAYRKHKKSLNRPVRGLSMKVWMGIFIGVLVLVTFAMPGYNPGPAATAPAKAMTLGEWLLEAMPCGVIVLLSAGFIWWLSRGKYRYRLGFEESTRLADPHALEAREEGVTISTPGCEMRMAWGYFLKFVETPGTFILFADARWGHIVPKRALGGEEQVKAFRDICAARVGQGVRAFPVEVGGEGGRV